MGLINANVELRNPRKPELEPVLVDALAASGSVHLSIPEHIRIHLKFVRPKLQPFHDMNRQTGTA